jgi:hypothetical protein
MKINMQELKNIKTKLFIALSAISLHTVCYGQPTSQPDKAILEKFDKVWKHMPDVKKNYTMAGTINVNDKAMPANDIKTISFLFCKQADDFYYKLGTTISINRDGAYLNIDNESKRIMVSEKKQVIYDNGLKDLTEMSEKIKGEHYTLTDKTEGSQETIAFLNEKHATCKYYEITFDKKTFAIRRLFMRLTNAHDPLRTDNEKIMDVHISRWERAADISNYPGVSSFIRLVKGQWTPVNEYKNYQLVKM